MLLAFLPNIPAYSCKNLQVVFLISLLICLFSLLILLLILDKIKGKTLIIRCILYFFYNYKFLLDGFRLKAMFLL